MNFIADMHTHTIASAHAYSTVTENCEEAHRKGLVYLGLTDHGPKMADAPHEWHFYNQTVLPDVIKGTKILRGIEADLMDYNGTLDVPSFMYGCLQWVNVSYHDICCKPGTKEQHTQSYIAAAQNKKVCVLCHTDDPRYVYDCKEVTKACKENNVLIELNVSRINRSAESVELLKRDILPACADIGCNIIVNSDAHYLSAIGDFEKAELLLCEIGFPQELVINADLERFENFLKIKEIKI